jgi:hypothetical protein
MLAENNSLENTQYESMDNSMASNRAVNGSSTSDSGHGSAEPEAAALLVSRARRQLFGSQPSLTSTPISPGSSLESKGERVTCIYYITMRK